MLKYFKTAGFTGCFSYKYSLVYLGVLFGLLFFLHLQFINSDPDRNIDTSRGPFTDEGLNTCQIRNYINHNDLTFKKSDNFVKTPLFGISLYLPFKIFGTSKLVGRLSVLLISLLILFFVFKEDKYYRRLAVPVFVIVLSEYYIFQYSHFCLAEIVSTCLIFFAFFLLVKSLENKNIKLLIVSATIISMSYYFKIQFLYVVVIMPFSILVFWIFKFSERKWLVKAFIYLSATLMFFAALYLFFWYLPNKNFYDYVMADQTKGRFIALSSLIDYLRIIIEYYFYNKYLNFFTHAFYFLCPVGILLLIISDSKRYKMLFVINFFWFLIELHKLVMTYLPTRYLVSFFFSMGIMMALVCYEMIRFSKYKRLNILTGILAGQLLLGFLVKNSKDYIGAYKSRTYEMLKIDNYLSKYNFEKTPVIGAWAPALAWKCKAVTFPVWRNYFNDNYVIEIENPAIIISELGEEDSDRAYQSKYIDIDNKADSIMYFKVNNWELKLLWMKKQ